MIAPKPVPCPCCGGTLLTYEEGLSSLDQYLVRRMVRDSESAETIYESFLARVRDLENRDKEHGTELACRDRAFDNLMRENAQLRNDLADIKRTISVIKE